ncbi:hypothetical protein LAZ67_3001746, partial [Cordylochernes scorpioides]
MVKRCLSANKSGTLNVKINNIPIAIHGLIVDGIKQNLLSVGKITQQGHQVIFKQDEVIIITRNHNFKCNNYRNLYSLKIEIDSNPESVTAHAVKTDDTLWHRRLGHLNRYSLKKLGLPSSQEKCETCIKGKSTRRSFQVFSTKEIGELIHSDLSGPIDPPTYDGEIYFQVLIDDYSHFVVVRLLKSKSEAEQNIIDFIKLIKTQHNKKTRKITVDNGKEFSSGNFKQFCRKKGIQIEYTSPYTPQQNGTSERMNRTLIDKVRTKLAETNLPKYLWGEAIYCSAYELNRSPTSANKGIPPASIWYKQNDLSKLKVFGSRAWRLILPKPRKLDARAKSTIMVGYSGSGYRIWDPETDKVMISTDVTFDETLTKFDKEIISDQTEPKRIITESQDEEETPQTSEQSDKEESVTTRSGRIIKPPRYQEDYELYSVYCLFTNGEDPVSYNQAIKQKEWKEAIDKEIQSHEELKTWSSIKLGEKSNIKPIDTKWIFRTKEDGTKKARLVAKGFKMEESSDIMYAPVARMSTIRMLLSHAINKNWEVNQMDFPTWGAYIYSSDDKLIGTGNFDGNMYTLNLSRLPETTHVPNEHCLISKDNSRTAWHRRLGHPCDNKLDLILKNNLLKGLNSINGTLDQCDACSLGKMTKVPYVHTDSNQESYSFEAIYVDLCGPMRINSLGGSKYFLTIVDGFSRRIFVEFLKDKLSAAEVLKKFIVKRENELNSKLKRVRTDNGTEFINKNLETFIESKGIKHELTTPYTPRSNGRVERANRTLLDKGRTLLTDSQLPLHFWAEAVNTAAYLYNLTPTTNDPDTTPMEKWKARVILETADIHFRENNNVISEEKQSDNNTDTDTYFFIQEDEQLDNHVLSDVDIEEPAPDTMINRQTESSGSDRPQITRTIPKRFDDYVLVTTNETIPKDYDEAIACEDKKHWENAMLEEIQNMYSHQVWELVPRPVNAKVVKSKWVFKISKDQENKNKTYKARLVAMGYKQIPGRDYNESFSPVIKNATLRTILSMAATKDSVIKLFDVNAAYLNGNIENTIFMEQLAYGLPQSGRSWYEKFSQVLHDCGLEKLKSDPCLFKWKNEDKYFYVGIYVDDFITVSDSEDTPNRFINKLRHHLEIKDVTCKGMFLGIKIIQDKEGISLQQSHYVQRILQKYGMENCKEVPTPGSKEINLDNHIEDDNCDQHTYQEALGMLMFLAVNIRPNIAYITSKLSQYSRQPKQMHWTAIKGVMRYLRGTIDLGVKFERGKAGTRRPLYNGSGNDSCLNQQSGSSKQDEALLHRQAQTKPKDTQRSFQDAKKNTKCHYCHKIGHWSRECRKRLANEKNKSKNLHDSKGSSSDYGLILCDNQVEPNDIWYADSGASCSMTFRREWFKTYTPFTSDHPIYLGDNSTLLAEGMGDIEIQAYVDGGCYNTYIRNVLYSPQLKKKLYSLSTSTRRGFNVIIKHDKLQIFMDNDLKAVGVRHDGLYRMLFKVTSSSQGYITSENKLQLWHERLAHLPVATLREMATKGLVDGLQPQDLEGDFFFCEGCQLGKAHRKSCYPSDGKNYQLGEFIYADICGPMQTQSLSKYLYFCLFKDYFSGYRHIYFIKNKSDVLDIFKEYATLIYTQTGNKIKVLRTDNALEFKSDNFADLCKRFGIIHEFTAPYVHEQIGRIERDNRTIVEAARSMLNSRNLPGFFWAEACNTATYILNRSATKQTPGTTPYELFFGTKPNVANYKIFGCNAYMHIPKENRKKWDNKSIKLMFLGYENTSKNFRLWDWKTRKIRISKDVTFDEKATTHSDRESTKPKEIIFQINSAPDESPVATTNIPVQEMLPVSDISSHPMITRSKVSNSQCNFALADEPSNYIDAITSSDSERWKLAMDEEIDALNKNKTWTLERLADGHKPIGCKWVYKIKTESDGTIQRFKARLVAKGYSQIKNVDYFDTFSPVVRYDSLRILLSHAASERMFLKQFDVKTAFLNGELEELVYLEQPEGYKRDDNSCYRLHKSLYGLRQSSRNWNKKFTNFLYSHNFKSSDADPCIFIGTHNDSNVILALYVDDGIILSKDKEAIAIIMDELEHAFDITSGSVNFFVGLQIEQSEDRASIFIHQSSYIDKILSKFNMADCIPASVPMDPSVILTKQDCPTPEQKEKMPKFPFREAVGSLMFASCVSRPDITHAVSQVSKFLEYPGPAYCTTVKNIFRYLKGTPHMGILFTGQDQLVGYSDSDFARDVDSRKNTTGYAFMMNGGTVSWASQRQPIIALSTTESEYIAACSAAKELIWIRRLLQGIGCDITKETELYIDNQAAIKLVKNPVFHKRTKHIDVRYHFIRSKHEEGELKVHHVCSSEQLADKPLPRNKFHYLRGLLNILDREEVLALICVFDIVENPPVSEKYAALKERLLLRFGRSRQVRTAQVSETKPIADQRPSIILVELSKPPPSQHCDPCTPTSNSLQHLEQTAFPRDMNITTTAPVTTVHNVEDNNSSSTLTSPNSSLSNSSSLDSSSFCSNPPSNTISCPPETVFSTPVHNDNPLPQQPPSHEEPLPQQPPSHEEPLPQQPPSHEEPLPQQPPSHEGPLPQQPPSHEEPLPQQPPSHEEPLPPSCEQKHPLFLKETNNAAATTPLHLQPAQTSVPQPLQPQNTLQQSLPPIESRVTTSPIPIAPQVLSATTPIAEQPIVSLQANKMVATHYIRTTFEKDRCLPQAPKTRSQPNKAPYQEFPLRLHRIFKDPTGGGVV